MTEPVLLCANCRTVCDFPAAGSACPECGLTSPAIAEYRRVSDLITVEAKRLTDLYPFRWAVVEFRGTLERGGEDDSAAQFVLKFLKHNYIDLTILDLPKWEVVALGFRRSDPDRRVSIHLDEYNPAFYSVGLSYTCVPLSLALAMPMKPLFDMPEETDEKAPLFLELFLLLHLVQAQNRLWRALLADGFYLLPPQAGIIVPKPRR